MAIFNSYVSLPEGSPIYIKDEVHIEMAIRWDQLRLSRSCFRSNSRRASSSTALHRRVFW